MGRCIASSFENGGSDYSAILGDSDLGNAAVNTVLFSFVSVSIEMALGLLFALLLNESFRGRGAVRAISLIPWALPTAVMAMSWKWIFNDQYGISNDLLARFGLIDQGIAWLGGTGTAFAALVVADVWKTTPFVTLILLAGLQSIPADLYEAISVDGAGRWRRFWWITLPLLRPAMALALVFRLIQALGVFDLVRVMTDGGPAASTRTVALYVQDNVYRYDKVAYGSALTVVFALGVFAIALAAGRLVRGRVRS
jgi:multiple sugar transport system permease protein